MSILNKSSSPSQLKQLLKGPCERVPSAKRPICIGASIEQRPWNATLRKAPIASQPIPGKPSYQAIPAYMGSHVIDSKKKSAPAYSIGRKVTRKTIYTDAGPAKYNIRNLCNRGQHTAPAYSLIGRTTGVKTFQGPAATSNVYYLPPIFGTAKEGKIKAAPAFSMLGRAKPRQIPTLNVPGPGEYENNYRILQKISPRYSLHCKHKVISDEHMKPGPGAHCPEKFIKHKSVPAPSFSIRHTPYLGQRKAYLIPECRVSAKAGWIL